MVADSGGEADPVEVFEKWNRVLAADGEQCLEVADLECVGTKYTVVRRPE